MSYYYPEPPVVPSVVPSIVPSVAVPSGLGDEGIVGNWLFYYLKGGNHLHDFSPYGNHGTINGAKWVDGRYGWALDFDGVDDYVDLNTNDLGITASFTISLWGNMNVSEAKSTNTLVSKRKEWLTNNIEVKADGGEIKFIIQTSSEDDRALYAYNADVWYFITAVYDATAGEMYLYINGSKEATVTHTSGVPDNTAEWWFGEVSGGGGENLNGSMDEVRIYNRALSSSEIQAIYNRTKGIFGL